MNAPRPNTPDLFDVWFALADETTSPQQRIKTAGLMIDMIRRENRHRAGDYDHDETESRKGTATRYDEAPEPLAPPIQSQKAERDRLLHLDRYEIDEDAVWQDTHTSAEVFFKVIRETVSFLIDDGVVNGSLLADKVADRQDVTRDHAMYMIRQFFAPGITEGSVVRRGTNHHVFWIIEPRFMRHAKGGAA